MSKDVFTDRFVGKTAVVYGDSIVYGSYRAKGDPGAVSRVEKPWCEFLPELLGLKSVANCGEPGISISCTSPTLPDRALSQNAAALPEADLILIAAGTNDFGNNVVLGSPEDTEDISFYGAVDRLCRSLKEKYAKSDVIFITPIPRIHEDRNFNGNSLEEYREILAEVAGKRYGFFVIDGKSTKLDPNDRVLLSDGTHPTPQGYDAYAKRIAEALTELFPVFTKGAAIPRSRHPHILYWFWTDEILSNEKYLRDIDTIAADGTYDTMIISGRCGMEHRLWTPRLKPHLAKTVSYAHERGIRVVLQLWPKGFYMSQIDGEIREDEMSAIVTETEAVVENGIARLSDTARHIRYTEYSIPEFSRLIRAYALKKTGEGTYEPGSRIDVTDRAEIKACEAGHIEAEISLPEAEGYTVYAMTAHYHRVGDLHCGYYVKAYREIMDSLSDIPLDGVVLDEFKNMPLLDFKAVLRERYYGVGLRAQFESETGKDLDETLFEMRFAPDGDSSTRAAAINRYFDFLRRSTERVENFVADYSRRIFGEDSFIGLHNTFHNSLHNDEIYATGCNWWKMPRKYAQTDEDIIYPVRMGLAARCPENLVYDMFYSTETEAFTQKAARDAKYGCRIHYHAMNDYRYGVDTGSPVFLNRIHSLEQKIDLLNLFDPAMPDMPLLVVFGFPAVCNWYPDESARTSFDLNGKVNIFPRTKALWNDGYLCALVPDDAILDGEIVRNPDGTFTYHKCTFRHLLFLYPKYGKAETHQWLKDAILAGSSVKVIGELSADFDGAPVDPEAKTVIASASLPEECDIPAAFGLHSTGGSDHALLADGSAAFSDLQSLDTGIPAHFSVRLGDHLWEGDYCGAAAIQADRNGGLLRAVCGGCRLLTRDGAVLFCSETSEDIAFGV